MPMYTFRCPQGHAFDLRVPLSTAAPQACLCGSTAERQSVYAINHTHPKAWGSEAKPPREFYEANAEAVDA